MTSSRAACAIVLGVVWWRVTSGSRAGPEVQLGPELPSTSFLMANANVSAPCVSKWTLGQTPEEIGIGAHAKVYAVYTTGMSTSTYALKYALTRDDIDDIEEEVKVMLAAARCANVMNVLDATPCVFGLQLFGAYVTTKMKASLDTWIQTNRDKKEKCRQSIGKQIYDGIKCLHNKNYIHGDLKPDNLLYEMEAYDGCPMGIRLADFGLSYETNSVQLTYPGDCTNSGHLPPGMFDICSKRDNLGIRVTTTRGERAFMAKENIDFCSLHYTMYVYLDVTIDPKTARDCGIQ